MQVDKVIQISSTVFKETVEIIWITKYEVFRFASASKLRQSYFDVLFIIVKVDFYNNRNSSLNVTFKFICKERKQASSALYSIFQSPLESTSFSALFCSCGGDLSDLLPVLLPNLITVLQLSVVP
jgi:hypothetical protein